MKRVYPLIYAVGLLFISVTYMSCKSARHQTKPVAIETRRTPTKKEVEAPQRSVPKIEVEARVEVEAAPPKAPSATKPTKTEGKTYTGGASYYADHFQGKKTASGEPYDREKNTAAVRLNALPLPFGSMVEVSSIKNNKSVIVRVNDKMGDKAKSIIDLSYEAAKAIGLLIDGRTEVTIRVISIPEE
ncbi:MAG: septal ring lytic transglycosylase RlpA family protein [Flavobacteriales bacterium]|nr:septal ring lytic transglycosylase RlpA family protein [Flavobacteriales bacterium]